MHGDPREEFDRQSEAAELIGSRRRSAGRTTPFGAACFPAPRTTASRPSRSSRRTPSCTSPAICRCRSRPGSGRCVNRRFAGCPSCTRAASLHRDAELHNFIVCASPLEIVMIDFEGAATRKGLAPEAWDEAIRTDFDALAKEGALLQCSLGRQRGGFAEHCLRRGITLFRDPSGSGRDRTAHRSIGLTAFREGSFAARARRKFGRLGSRPPRGRTTIRPANREET